LLLLLRPAALGGLRWLLLLRPAALSPLLLLIGSPALHSRLLCLIRLLLTLLLLTLLLLIAACWSLTGRRFTSALTNGARGIVTEPTPLAGGEWLCWRYISAWLNDVLRFTHRYLSALSSSSSKILRAYFHRTLNVRGSRQDARPHLIGAEWSSNGCCYNRRSNPWIDCDRLATLTKHDRLVHDHGLADEDFLLARRQNDAHETGCDEIAGPHENPHIGLVAIFDHDLVRRQRRPTDVLSSSPPLHPSRAPFPSSDPNPSQFAIEEVITLPSKCSDDSTSGRCCLALNSYFTNRIFQPSSLHMQLTSSEARMQRLKYGTNSTKTSVPLGSSWQLLQKLDAVPFSLCIMRATTLSISSRVLHFVGFFSTATQFSRG
jgi:hypothetical protein